MMWDPGKKYSNQIQHPVLMKEFLTLQRAWHSLIPGSNLKGLISGVRIISWLLNTETISLAYAKMQLVGGVAK